MIQEEVETLETTESGLTLWLLSKDEARLIESIEKLPITYRSVILELTELVVELHQQKYPC